MSDLDANGVQDAGKKTDLSAEAVAAYLDEGAAKEYPDDPESQKHAANMMLYAAVENNLYKLANNGVTPFCGNWGLPSMQVYDHENPYGFCGDTGVKATNEFLEQVKKLENPNKGLDLNLGERKPGWSYPYEATHTDKP